MIFLPIFLPKRRRRTSWEPAETPRVTRPVHVIKQTYAADRPPFRDTIGRAMVYRPVLPTPEWAIKLQRRR